MKQNKAVNDIYYLYWRNLGQARNPDKKIPLFARGINVDLSIVACFIAVLLLCAQTSEHPSVDRG